MDKLVYISMIAAPHQIKLCRAMNSYFDAEFWFYDELGERAKWWKINLSDREKIIPNVFVKFKSKYITLSHLKMLKKFNPDIVMLGGISVPANYLAYRWAKRNNKKTILFTERSRDANGNLRKASLIWKFLSWIYRNVDLLMVSEADIVPQFRDEFNFGSKVKASRYASDIDAYMKHEIRGAKNESYKLMFPNRLTDIYNPLGAITIFKKLNEKYPATSLNMNAVGELRTECEELVEKYGLNGKVTFLDNISSWDDLHLEYKKCDIMILPAKFSNGNFTIIEAMASGMGIVISENVLGVGNYIENKINGYNIPLDNDLFIKAVESFFINPELFQVFGKINKDQVRPLGPDGTAKLYSDLISEIK